MPHSSRLRSLSGWQQAAGLHVTQRQQLCFKGTTAAWCRDGLQQLRCLLLPTSLKLQVFWPHRLVERNDALLCHVSWHRLAHVCAGARRRQGGHGSGGCLAAASCRQVQAPPATQPKPFKHKRRRWSRRSSTAAAAGPHQRRPPHCCSSPALFGTQCSQTAGRQQLMEQGQGSRRLVRLPELAGPPRCCRHPRRRGTHCSAGRSLLALVYMLMATALDTRTKRSTK